MMDFILKALQFGVLGLCAVMLVLAWRIIEREQLRVGHVRRGVIILATLYMFFCVVLGGLSAWVQLRDSGDGQDGAEGGLYREYEWQWAGENWYGRVLFEKENEQGKVKMARVYELRKKYSDKVEDYTFELGESPVLDCRDGEVTQFSENKIRIRMVGNKTTVERPGEAQHVIEGVLRRVPCFAGEVKFKNQSNKRVTNGKMILVGYISLKGSCVADKFEPSRRRDGSLGKGG